MSYGLVEKYSRTINPRFLGLVYTLLQAIFFFNIYAVFFFFLILIFLGTVNQGI